MSGWWFAIAIAVCCLGMLAWTYEEETEMVDPVKPGVEGLVAKLKAEKDELQEQANHFSKAAARQATQLCDLERRVESLKEERDRLREDLDAHSELLMEKAYRIAEMEKVVKAVEPYVVRAIDYEALTNASPSPFVPGVTREDVEKACDVADQKIAAYRRDKLIAIFGRDWLAKALEAGVYEELEGIKLEDE